MAKIKKTTQPKKTVKKQVKKVAPKATKKSLPQANFPKNLLEKLKKINLKPVAIFLVAVFLVTALFVFIRKNVIVATINGQPLTRFEVINTLEKQAAKQVVDGLISEKLLTQEAKQKKIEISAEDIDTEIGKIKKQLKEQGSELQTALAAQGLSEKELKKQIELKLLLEKLLGDKTKVTDKEVNKYISENKELFPEEMKEAELKKSVREQLVNQKLSTAAQELITKLKEQAKIKYFINY